MSASGNGSSRRCGQDLVTAFEAAFGECSNATGVSTVLGITQPATESQRQLLCSTVQCTDLYRLFRNNAEENCTVGTLIVLNEANVNQVLAVCTTAAPTIAPNATQTPTSTTLAPTSVVAKSSGSNTGVVVGSVVGGVVVLVVLALLFAWYRRRQRKQGRGADSKDGHYETMPTTPKTEPSDSGPWSDPVITAIRIPLEKVKFGELLSQGAYGEVFQGTYNDQHVAIKRILPARRRVLTHIHGFLDEIKLTASLEHDRIVKFIGVAWDSLSDICMVTEFMWGGDLRQLLIDLEQRNEPHGFEYNKLKIAIQIAHALTYLHSLQPIVIHRDLKSRNILLTEELNAKLIDFGVSRERRDITMTAGVGSSLWMAPEVMLGERYDEKADIFSFGVVLSELDTHQLPYSQLQKTSSDQKAPDMIVMQMVSQGQLQVQFSDNAAPQVVELAHSCLALDPRARPSVAEVLHKLHTIWRKGGLV